MRREEEGEKSILNWTKQHARIDSASVARLVPKARSQNRYGWLLLQTKNPSVRRRENQCTVKHIDDSHGTKQPVSISLHLIRYPVEIVFHFVLLCVNSWKCLAYLVLIRRKRKVKKGVELYHEKQN